MSQPIDEQRITNTDDVNTVLHTLLETEACDLGTVGQVLDAYEAED